MERPLTASLAERLKSETQLLHSAAERSQLMGALLRGDLSRAAYAALLRNLHALYAALEPALARHRTHPLIAPVFLPALWRTEALERDLAVFHGPHWAEALALQPAAAAFVARIGELESIDAGLLLAHAYVRYLGDLSGGQILRALVAKSLPADEAGAVAFYDFGDAAATGRLTQAFRSALADAVVDASVADALVAEARLSFMLHRQLFEELWHAAGADDQESNSRMRATRAPTSRCTARAC